MSVGIAIKGSEGIILAADSRVTIESRMPGPDPGQIIISSSTFDSATKILHVAEQHHIGVVTYGLGALGDTSPRTVQSLLPEFEANLAKTEPKRMHVKRFAEVLGAFFSDQWQQIMPANTPPGNDLIFLVGGFDEGETYGRVFEVRIPSASDPVEWAWGEPNFGMVWGGQTTYIERLILGLDRAAVGFQVQQLLKQNNEQVAQFLQLLGQAAQAPISFQFLPLQDCIDLAVFLIKSTIQMQSFTTMGPRGVGGPVDVAVITRTEGFRMVQAKAIQGERSHK